MARPLKTGLSYFPLDVDFFNDDKIELISSEFGAKGEVIAIRLLCQIYRNGYFYQWGKDESLLFAKRVGNGVTGALVDEVVAGLVKRSFFDERVFNRFKILTSKGIQKRYLEAKDRAKQVQMAEEYVLLDVDTVKAIDNVSIYSINVSNNPQSKVKKSKEEKSKEKQNGGPDGNSFTNPFSEKFLQKWHLWKSYKKSQHRFIYSGPESEQAAINQLVKISEGDEVAAEAIIDQSMGNGWQGLFPLKNADNGSAKSKSANGKVGLHDVGKAFANRGRYNES